ncbi:MAG: fumarate reductase/succinate dehydrogenase flavoprotein subunit, partial [Oligoflexia bacterium]|nr:fumarate reductase/succinate dehydrogenase flavoprotein subunit [Oligoflexia bacterium]
MKLNSKIPGGPLEQKWENHKFNLKLVNPANKRKHTIIVVGTGLAGASAAASLAELGYQVKVFTFHDSPRRAHSIAAQGGINAAKNYPNDGDSVFRLFYDTIKGGDFRAREANVYRLAEVSNAIIDQCVAQGVPFAREYGGLLDNRSFGGAQVSRTFYARGQTGQQLLLGAYSAMMRQVGLGALQLFNRREMLELVVAGGAARGIVVRNLVTGQLESHAADAVVLATGGYGNVFYLSTNAKGSNATAIWKAYKKGAAFANPCFTQIHPTCIPVSGDHQSKLTLMSESLRNDGRVWVPKKKGDTRPPAQIPDEDRDYYLERVYPSFGNLAPRDVSSRQAKFRCDEGLGVGESRMAVYLDFRDAIKRLGRDKITERYGNLFQMYEKITDENPYEVPMRIFPAVHYTMGGLWVDYNLMSNLPGLHVLGEANFSDHGANRLGASALMQGLADGYFVIPYTIGDYLAGTKLPKIDTTHEAFRAAEADALARLQRLLTVKGTKTVDELHRKLGKLMWEYVGMSRNEAGLKT